MVADPENPLVLNVLHASSTAYSFNPDQKIDDVSFYIKSRKGPGIAINFQAVSFLDNKKYTLSSTFLYILFHLFQ